MENRKDWTSVAVKKSVSRNIKKLIGKEGCRNANDVIEMLFRVRDGK